MPEYKEYARKRMEQRHVSDEDVVSALSRRIAPDRPGNSSGRRIVRGLDARGNILDVVLNEYGEIVNVFRP